MPHRRVEYPPDLRDARLMRWLQQVAEALNALPQFSFISTTGGPNDSGQTGDYGTIAIDLGSSTTAMWVKKGSGNTAGWEDVI